MTLLYYEKATFHRAFCLFGIQPASQDNLYPHVLQQDYTHRKWAT